MRTTIAAPAIVVGLAVAGLVAGCATKPVALPPLVLPPAPILAGPAEPKQAKPAAPAPMVVPWMVVNDFFPPGAKKIVSRAGFNLPRLAEGPRAWFPSTEELGSPNTKWTLFHDGHRAGEAIDYVIFARPEEGEKTKAVLQTRRAMELLWAPDSRHVAVTVLTGDNRSYVFVLDVSGPKLSEPISAAEALKDYMSSAYVAAPQFMMALRWTETGELVIRARGQQSIEPYTVFGYEVVADVDRLQDPTAVRFLRGFTKSPDPGESRNNLPDSGPQLTAK